MVKTALFIAFTFTSIAAHAAEEPCDTSHIAETLAQHTGTKWNRGKVRSWDEFGEFWSMPLRGKATDLPAVLRKQFESECDVIVADAGGFTARIIAKQDKAITKEAASAMMDHRIASASSPEESIISDKGTTIGLFSPGPGENIIIMYPAKIASAIARGKGSPKFSTLRETSAKISPELDIEYNFGNVQINVFGGSGKTSVREASQAVFEDLKSSGYAPNSQSQKQIEALNGLFPPESHESFWIKSDGIARVAIQRIKNGLTRVDVHETKELR